MVFSGGEVLSCGLQKRFFDKYPAKLINGYGPTETTIDVCHWVCKKDDVNDIVPIGKPIGNTQLYILDQRLMPVPIGAPGELYIGGDCLARGYLNQPELTAEKFIADPFSSEPARKLYKTGDLVRYLPGGEIVFMGRLDNQVKLRGFRIELGEIENAIRQYHGIQQVFIMVRDDRPGDKRLVAYIIPASGTILEVDKLRSFLREKIPAHLIPSAFVMIDTFPLTVNGKIDWKALPAPDQGTLGDRELVAPRNTAEQILCQIWMSVLGRDRLSVEDNFFDIGGNSLLAIQVMARIRKEFEIVVPVTKIFEYPSLSDLALQVNFLVLYQKPASGVPEDTKGRTEYTL
jgi:acyl-CoA synthetase (AMP-forming)/AMP-acid ligase II/acyl carrier protein